MALDAGIPEEVVAGPGTWAGIAEAILNTENSSASEETSEEGESEGEEEVEEETTEEPRPLVKGDMVLYRPVDQATGKRVRKAIQCEVIASDKAGIMQLKNVARPNTVYKGVKAEAVELVEG